MSKLRTLSLALVAAALVATTAFAQTPKPVLTSVRSLDGSGNNQAHPSWGQAGQIYPRVGPANYSDGIGAMQPGPSPRWISNRVFNDVGQNIFSENNISQWGWAWGQFIDHDLGLRVETPGESAPMPFDATDVLEKFKNDLGLSFSRTPAAPGTGVTTTRQQINTISNYIDGSQVYGSDPVRSAWLRDPNGYDLLMSYGYLPRAWMKPNAPAMDLFGGQVVHPELAVVAGDVRANENIGLTAIQTLFAREHNRIADSLPATLVPEERFQIARRVVGAEIQYITYTQWLPALGVELPAYAGYRADVDPSLSDEFATVGFRAHSMIHGEFEPNEPAATYGPLAAGMAAHGILPENMPDHTITFHIPLGVAFGNPDLLPAFGLGSVIGSLGQPEYRNDEQIDNALRSVLFQVPKPDTVDPSICGNPSPNPSCFSGVSDLGALDVQRDRDHGMPTYNQMRVVYGLPPVSTFKEITGDTVERFPNGVTDANSMDFLHAYDADGKEIPLLEAEGTLRAVRRTTLASRLRALYGSVDKVDAFVGMLSEPHAAGVEMGALQRAIWAKQFAATRDGDAFFYQNDPALNEIWQRYHIGFKNTLAHIVKMDTGEVIADDAFHAADES